MWITSSGRAPSDLTAIFPQDRHGVSVHCSTMRASVTRPFRFPPLYRSNWVENQPFILLKCIWSLEKTTQCKREQIYCVIWPYLIIRRYVLIIVKQSLSNCRLSSDTLYLRNHCLHLLIYFVNIDKQEGNKLWFYALVFNFWFFVS